MGRNDVLQYMGCVLVASKDTCRQYQACWLDLSWLHAIRFFLVVDGVSAHAELSAVRAPRGLGSGRNDVHIREPRQNLSLDLDPATSLVYFIILSLPSIYFCLSWGLCLDTSVVCKSVGLWVQKKRWSCCVQKLDDFFLPLSLPQDSNGEQPLTP